MKFQKTFALRRLREEDSPSIGRSSLCVVAARTGIPEGDLRDIANGVADLNEEQTDTLWWYFLAEQKRHPSVVQPSLVSEPESRN